MTKDELIHKLSDIEWDDFEVKAAKNELPKNIWETVSAFANSIGGWIVLGVAQNGKKFEIEGVENPEKIEQDFTSVLRSGQKFNQHLLFKTSKYVIDSKVVLAFYISSSKFKPVYINNPTNTFIRVCSGDQRATDAEIMAMYHDQSFGIKSEEFAKGTSINDLNPQSLNTFRNHVRSFNASFPYNDLDDNAFCRKIGICSNVSGELTYGSLLMLGKQDIIREFIPNFWVDYIEIPSDSVATAVPRYTFRMQEQENIWEYYNVIIQRLRLYADNPFTTTKTGVSPDDESRLYVLREGLINFLAHSDWFSPMHPTIRVFTNRIEFQNPGGFIVPVEKVEQEAISLPRNPIIIKLFRAAKLAENAGYGIDKIKTWTSLTGQLISFKSEITHSTIIFSKISGLGQLNNPENVTGKSTEKRNSQTEVKENSGQVGGQVGGQVSGLVSGQVRLDEQLLSLLKYLLGKELSLKEIKEFVEISSRRYVRENIVKRLLDYDIISMTQPDSPNSPTQKYYLTEKGKSLI